MSDFEDDPDESVNSISRYSSNIRNGPGKDFPLRDETSTLQNLLDSKTREVEHLSNLLSIERKQHKAVIDELEKRIAIADAEKERALMNRNQTHELLVEHKQKLMEKNDDNQALLSKIKSLEKENEKLVAELESTKLLLSDVQTKYHMVEKNVMFNAERNTDQIVKQAQERHSAQMTMMQQQIDGLKTKYDDLEHEHKHLDIRYRELQRSREALLIEKSEIINQLNRNLEESQRQVQDLLGRPDMTQENCRLKNALRTVEYQKDELSLSNEKLQKKLQEKSSELELMDSVIHEFDINNASFAEMTKLVHRDPLKNSNASTPMSPEVRLSKVKEELCKSLNNIKAKRAEIKILEQQLTEKDKEITELRRDESKNLIELNKYRDDVMRLESKVNMLQNELDKATALTPTRPSNVIDLNLHNELMSELHSKKAECDELRVEMEKLCLSSDYEKCEKLEKENDTLKSELTELKTKLESNSLKACQKCEENETKMNEIKLSTHQLQNTNAEQLKNLENLEQEIAAANQTIKNLEQKINLQNLRDQEIEKLQSKAKEFELFMRNNIRFENANSSPSTTTESQNSSTSARIRVDASTETENSGDEQLPLPNRNQLEIKIRDEMARIFANQISTLEKKFTAEVKRMQSQNLQLTSELNEKSSNLNVAMEQLEMLKFTIIAEREEFQKHMQQKDNNIEYYRKQVEDLNEKVDIIYEERDSIENLKRQIEDERKVLSQREEETLQKLKKVQEESKKTISDLNEKLLSKKKMALNYKQVNKILFFFLNFINF